MKRAVIAAGAVVAFACAAGRTQQAPTPIVSSAPLTFAPAPPSGSDALPRVERLFDDTRLAGVRDYDAQNMPDKSAALLNEVRRVAVTPSTGSERVRCTLAYAEARRWILADRIAEAQDALLVAMADACPLRDYAKVASADLALRARDGRTALAVLPAAPPSAIAAETELMRADALLLSDARPAAGRIYRSWIAEHAKGPRYGEIAVRFAEVGLAGAFPPGEPWAVEAHAAVVRTLVDFPRWAQKMGTADVFARIAAAANRPSELTALERARRAQGLLDGSSGDRARAELTTIAGGLPSEASCKAALVLASARKKGDRSDGWEQAITRCAKDADLPTALYSGAKDASRRHDDTLALARFARVEQEFPTHRLADDARMRTATLHRDRGDDARFVAALTTLPATYPDGDMKAEARFRLALYHAEQRRWQEAGAALEGSLEESCRDRHWATAGRIEFFRARAAQKTGDLARARELYTHLIGERSLYFYGLRAYARLSAMDPQAAARAMDAARARSAAIVFPSEGIHADIASNETDRAMALLSIEESDAAKRELGSRSKSPDWSSLSGHWLNEAGAFDVGHSFARAGDPPFLDTFPHGASRYAWEAAYPPAFQALVEAEAARNGVPKSLVWGIMREESDFIADAKSHSNAIGLMQFMLPTAKWIATGTGITADETSLKKPEIAIALGARLLAKLRSQFPRNTWLAIAAYNSGKGSVDRWTNQMGALDLETFVEKIPYDETRNYVKRVLMSQAVYAALYEPHALQEVLDVGATWPEAP